MMTTDIKIREARRASLVDFSLRDGMQQIPGTAFVRAGKLLIEPDFLVSRQEFFWLKFNCRIQGLALTEQNHSRSKLAMTTAGMDRWR